MSQTLVREDILAFLHVYHKYFAHEWIVGALCDEPEKDFVGALDRFFSLLTGHPDSLVKDAAEELRKESLIHEFTYQRGRNRRNAYSYLYLADNGKEIAANFSEKIESRLQNHLDNVFRDKKAASTYGISDTLYSLPLLSMARPREVQTLKDAGLFYENRLHLAGNKLIKISLKKEISDKYLTDVDLEQEKQSIVHEIYEKLNDKEKKLLYFLYQNNKIWFNLYRYADEQWGRLHRRTQEQHNRIFWPAKTDVLWKFFNEYESIPESEFRNLLKELELEGFVRLKYGYPSLTAPELIKKLELDGDPLIMSTNAKLEARLRSIVERLSQNSNQELQLIYKLCTDSDMYTSDRRAKGELIPVYSADYDAIMVNMFACKYLQRTGYSLNASSGSNQLAQTPLRKVRNSLRKNRKGGMTNGRGFSKGEIKEIGINPNMAKHIGLYIDPLRRSIHKENIEFLRSLLKEFKRE